MTLDKAIQNNTNLLKHDYWTMTPINFDSIKLGLEALKRVAKMRTYKPTPPGMPLPGETPSGNPLPRLAACLNETKNQRGTK